MGNTQPPREQETRLVLCHATRHEVLIRNSGSDPEDNRGNVDTVIVRGSCGLVADGVGHDYAHTGAPADKRAGMAQVWDQFIDAQATWPQELSVHALDELVRVQIRDASEQFERLGKSSSLSCCFLARCNQRKRWAVCFSIADSVLVLVRDRMVQALTSSVSWQIEIGGDVRGMEASMHEVVCGDVILGLTDGVVDAMRFLGKGTGEEDSSSDGDEAHGDVAMSECCRGIESVLREREQADGDALLELLTSLFEATMKLTREGVVDSDDCSSFAMLV
eukprot:TRINITY_DN28059_c0_g1_i2.p1 TRINITY_DN28059_c0_g1~~TRINITY_DN28059_c0_g1_i2.p1  ORF type:complete len:277 (+),score=41.85 TRINITY_DN28059_c0_g1_i2:148-978(+)